MWYPCAVSRLGELTQKVDAFFARVAERHGEDMQCATGCSDCCHVRLTITAVEAAAIRTLVAGWPAERRRSLAVTGPGDKRSVITGGGDPDGSAGPTGISSGQGGARPLPRARSIALGHGAGVLPRGIDPCAALDPAGRCKIYDARPLVCRSHGVPIRIRQGALPIVQACHRNFTRTTPDPDCILDQTTLSAMLYAVNAAEGEPTDPRKAPSSSEPVSRIAETERSPGDRAKPEAPDERSEGSTERDERGDGMKYGLLGPADAPARRVELAGLLAELAAI
jgi:Fe-S-cluster containining protein